MDAQMDLMKRDMMGLRRGAAVARRGRRETEEAAVRREEMAGWRSRARRARLPPPARVQQRPAPFVQN